MLPENSQIIIPSFGIEHEKTQEILKSAAKLLKLSSPQKTKSVPRMVGKAVASPELKRITKKISEELEKEGWPPQDINWVIAIQIRNPLNPNAGQLHALSLCDLRHGVGLMKHLVEDYERRFHCTVNAAKELPYVVGGEA